MIFVAGFGILYENKPFILVWDAGQDREEEGETMLDLSSYCDATQAIEIIRPDDSNRDSSLRLGAYNCAEAIGILRPEGSNSYFSLSLGACSAAETIELI